MIVLKKHIREERGQVCLGNVVRYFFYVTSGETLSKEEVIFESNNRADPENLNAHLKSGIRALHAPLNTLAANWAYMVIARWLGVSRPGSRSGFLFADVGGRSTRPNVRWSCGWSLGRSRIG